MTSFILTLFCFIVGSYLFLRWGLKQIYNYRIKEGKIEIRLFYIIPIKNIYFNKVISICGLSILELLRPSIYFSLMFSTQWWGNRITRRMVLIKQRSFIPHVVLTPDNPDQFIEQIMVLFESRKQNSNGTDISTENKTEDRGTP
jgi:hypothetical protein